MLLPIFGCGCGGDDFVFVVVSDDVVANLAVICCCCVVVLVVKMANFGCVFLCFPEHCLVVKWA